MKRNKAVSSLLLAAVAGAGTAAGQFTTSTTVAPVVVPRQTNAATLDRRVVVQTVEEVITQTIAGGGRTSSSGGIDDSNLNENDRTIRSSTDGNNDGQSNDNTSSSSSGLSAGAAAGITAAALIGVALLGVFAFLAWRRRQGGIRGAVVTTGYPREVGGGGKKKRHGDGGGEGGGMEEGGVPGSGPAERGLGLGSGPEQDMTERPLPPPPPTEQNGYNPALATAWTGGGYGPHARGVEEQDLGERSAGFPFPPAGTRPGHPGFDMASASGYPASPPQQQYQQYLSHMQNAQQTQRPQPQPHQQRQLWHGPDLGEFRPVSAMTATDSPGPILPVSPLTPYRPESSVLAAAAAAGPQQQRPLSSSRRTSRMSRASRASTFHHPLPPMPNPHIATAAITASPITTTETNTNKRVTPILSSLSSPDLPPFMIPGGNKTRAMSFSSVSRVGGSGDGPRVPELIGSPPPPVPSMMAVVEGGERMMWNGAGGAGERMPRRSYTALPVSRQ
ncbi:uncharacterized protein C8A04DRAFT_26608 [Dichotomopilus funicola]|uniref:Uncharacterized protein n=1 Tax=Dichotomopilus funicola TaxID=1934379 RepID=A0AAN6ZNA3_9PEZI|nr:hypothetical protein C8A04DRAFT_26608 [Dichotomopilus funicola]